MFHKFAASAFKKAHLQRQGFASLRRTLYNLFNQNDPTNPEYLAATFDPRVPLENHQGLKWVEQDSVAKVSVLKNGVRVLTLSQSVPSIVNMGVLLRLGTRNEDHDSSGSLLAIKNTYLKTVLNTNETVNYGMVQMSGGSFEMDYDQETTYFRASCLAHDVVDIFRMVSDCALEPKSAVAASVAQNKNKNTHKLEELVNTGEEFNNGLFSTAYGLKGLGMPLNGFKGNVGNLSTLVLQRFQLENINPKNIVVCGAGIENHDEFLELAENEYGNLQGGEGAGVTPSQYLGGELRSVKDGNEINMALAFESVNWNNSEQLFDFLVLNFLLGDPANRNNVLAKNLSSQKTYYDSLKSINVNFSDSGLFGVQISGSAQYGNQMIDEVCDQLKRLADKVNEDELRRAKKVLLNQILSTLEKQENKLEESARQLLNFGKVDWSLYEERIEKVNADSIRKSLGQALKKGKPTFVAFGGDANHLHSFDKIANKFA